MSSHWTRGLPITKNDEYLDFIRSMPCCVTGVMGSVVAHHVRSLGSAGIGVKPTDYLAVPLVAEIHMKLHNVGEAEFWEDICDPRDIIIACIVEWLTMKGGEK